MTPFEQQLLEGQQETLAQISALRVDCERRFAFLEQHDRECHGNGQPGWKAGHEARIGTLETERSEKQGGAHVWGWIGGAVLALVNIAVDFFHRK